MSSWPTHTDYQDSIQNPHICFEDEALKGGEVGCDMLGLPKVTSGNFACVYSLTTSEGRWAIRCFVRQVLGQQGRYARMAQHLLGLGMGCMVDFEYLLRGIKVANEWYPIVKMQWVDGLPLNQYLDEHLGDPARLKELADRFPPLVEELRKNHLAHCDLQHGNIMVTPDNEYRLVDYDGMYTPAFRGKSPELGHANFQHPRRTPDFYNEQVDNFSAIVIYLSLLAVADDPPIFEKFYAADNLLMTSADYRNPKDSEVIKVLKEHRNEEVKALAVLLEKCCLIDVSKVPEFSEVVEALKKGEVEGLVDANVSSGRGEAPVGAGASGWWDASGPEPGAGAREAASPKPAGASPVPDYLSGGAAAPAPTPQAPRPPAPKPAAPRKPTYANAAPAKPAGGGFGATPSTRAGSTRAAQSQNTAAQFPVSTPPSVEEDSSTKLYLALGIGGVCVIVLLYLLGKSI